MRPNMIVGAICLISTAALAACQPAQSLDVATTDAQPLRLEAPPARKAPTAKATVKKAAPTTTAVMASRAGAARQEQDSISTTVTGCLELRDDGMFQLKDTDGEHAPKARSWKSGFVKKGSAKINVFDAGNRLKLGTHVGHRVSIGGMLADRQLRARSLESTSEACE
jgi:hypothetical protein